MQIHLALFALWAAVAAELVSYEGYKVYRIQPSGEQQVGWLRILGEEINLDFWSPLRRDGSPVDVMIDPQTQHLFEDLLKQEDIEFKVQIDNVERIFDEERTNQLMAPRVGRNNISFTKYHRHHEINAYLDQLSKDHPDVVSLESIGKSYEGRDLKLIKISTDFNASKPVIFIDAGIHAREWAAPPVALYTIQQLVKNPENARLLDKVDYHILPVVNPDGYEYSHKKERLWRKTRSPGTRCFGTDGNRNFGYHWAEIGSSHRECSEIYHGQHPFSELETAAIRDYVLRNKDNIKLYLTIHSYGQYILYPWGYTADLPEDSEELQAVGDLAAEGIKSVAGTPYTVGSSMHILYAAAGGSDDWVKGEGGVALSYTIELPGRGSGFDPPPSEILSIVTETWEGIKAFNRYVANKFG